jgi:endonuclease III-like uncharacterized protein
MSYDLKLNRGDIVIKNGDLQTAVDSEKLIQDILKICLTSVGTNPLNPWYGSFINRSIVGTAMDGNMLVQIAKSQLNTALENLKNLQEFQFKSFQNITADELLGAVLDIIVTRNTKDSRLFDVKIKALSKGLKPITTTFTVSAI